MIRRLALASALALALVSRRAEAQCAAQPSSCVHCHETGGRANGREGAGAWHRDHVAGDFCGTCHGGDPARELAAEAHAGMRDPLADPQRSCAPCHAGDAAGLAERYLAAGAQRADRTPGAAPASSPLVPGALRPCPAAARNGVVGAIVAAMAALCAAAVAFTERRRRRAAAHGGLP